MKVHSAVLGTLFFFLGLYLLTSGEGFYSSDGEVMYRTTWALVEEHTWAIPCDKSLPQGLRGADGRCYSTYGPGQPLAAIPFYMAGKVAHIFLPSVSSWDVTRFFAARFHQVVTALTCSLMLVGGKRLYGSSRAGLILALIYGLGTLAWPYSKFYFSEPLVGLCLLASFCSLLRYRDGGGLWLVLAGLALGYGFLTRLTTLIILPFFALYALSLASRKRGTWARALGDVAWMAGPIVLCGAAYLLHNANRFGNPLDFGYPGETWSTPPWVGLYGLMFSPGKGLFLFVPILLLSPWALVVFFRHGWRAEALLFAAVALFYILFHMSWWTWHGGWSWGPRFLVPALPFLILPLAAVWRWSWGRVATMLLGVLSLLPQVLGVAVDFNLYMLEVNDETKVLFVPRYSPLLGHLRHLIRGDHLSFGFFHSEAPGLPPGAMTFGVTLGLVLLTLGAVGFWLSMRSAETRSNYR